MSTRDNNSHRPIVVGCGFVGLDFVAAVDVYPKTDEKIRTTSLKVYHGFKFQVEGGCNAGNAMTCAARLSLNTRLISKVANDAHGRLILQELKSDGVDTSFIEVSEEGNSAFTYVVADIKRELHRINCYLSVSEEPVSLSNHIDIKYYSFSAFTHPLALISYVAHLTGFLY